VPGAGPSAAAAARIPDRRAVAGRGDNGVKINREPYRTGLPLIDRQHDTYLDMVERLLNASCRGGGAGETMAAETDKVIDCILTHFDAEEHQMRAVKYPRYGEHVSSHDSFRDRTEGLRAAATAGPDVGASIECLTWVLLGWLHDHVRAHDRKLAVYVNSHAPLATALAVPRSRRVASLALAT